MTLSTAQSDAELLAAFQSGQEDAFEEFYERHARALLAYLLGMLKDREWAEEGLQQVFIALARRVRDLPPDLQTRLYLFRSARNWALNAIRGRRRQKRLAERYELLARQRSTAPGPEQPLEAAGVRAELNAALRALSEEEREAILLHTQAELTFQEIAHLTEAPLGTVATRYRAGIEKLRRHLRHA